MNQVARKICATCGRQISWRKKWEKNWSTIIYCSNSCRSNKIRPNSLDTSFESKILSTLAERRKTHGFGAVVTCEEVEAAVLRERQDITASSAKYPGKESEIGGELDRYREDGSKTERDRLTNRTQKLSEPDPNLDPPALQTPNSDPNPTRSSPPPQGGKVPPSSKSRSSLNSDSSKRADQNQGQNSTGTSSTNSTLTRERCRQAARRLAERGEIQITQRGKVTDPSFTKGVMELKLPE